MLDGTIPGFDAWEDAVATQPATPIADEIGGRRPALLVGHHRAAEGRQDPAARRRARQGEPLRHPHEGAVRLRTGHRVPVAGAALPRGAAALQFDGAASGRDVRHHGALRRRGVPDADGPLPGHRHTGRADDVHPHAEAAGGRARAPRSVVATRRHPRRRALPHPGEGADDRVVGSEDQRVLCRHRGQRLLRHRLGGVAAAQGLGRARADGHRSTSSTRTTRSCRPASPERSTSRAATPSRTTRTRRRRPRARARRAGPRSATSATSTPTATST